MSWCIIASIKGGLLCFEFCHNLYMNYRKYTYESDFESQKAVCKSHASSSRQRCRLPMMQISHIFISPHGTGRQRQIEYKYAWVTTSSAMFWVSARVCWLNFIPRQCTHYAKLNWAMADNAIVIIELLKSLPEGELEFTVNKSRRLSMPGGAR